MKVFERFYQAHPSRSGMGLGLYISRQVVEMHGARSMRRHELPESVRTD